MQASVGTGHDLIIMMYLDTEMMDVISHHRAHRARWTAMRKVLAIAALSVLAISKMSG
jgi:hypothetical protein